MDREDKQELVCLLKKFKKDISKNWPDGNNLPYELSLLDLKESAELIIEELKAQLKQNYSFKDLK